MKSVPNTECSCAYQPRSEALMVALIPQLPQISISIVFPKLGLRLLVT